MMRLRHGYRAARGKNAKRMQQSAAASRNRLISIDPFGPEHDQMNGRDEQTLLMWATVRLVVLTFA
jgi:hypothetical protein